MRPTNLKKITYLLIIFFFITGIGLAQMPDWTLIKDRDGNKYFFDKNGKIWTLGEPEFKYKPVSKEGLDYFINQATELIRSGYYINGLIILKSIMAMPVDNERIVVAQRSASKEINYLVKKEGTRFTKLNNHASILLFRESNTATIVNDYMAYSIKVPVKLKIINKKIREKIRYVYYGLSLGLNLNNTDIEERDGYYRYDLMLAIDSERFSSTIRSVKKIELFWRKRLGADTFERKIFKENPDVIIYNYKDSIPPYYSGFEGFYFKGNQGYHLRTICSRDMFLKYKEKIITIVKSFKL